MLPHGLFLLLAIYPSPFYALVHPWLVVARFGPVNYLTTIQFS
jgi:hypothetical protein